MVSRLRPILGEVVSINQSAFVPSRLITDNALVMFECFHFIEHNANENKDFCAYKLDLSKAYDRVDCDFLKRVMQTMGFSRRWVDWIMACFTSMSYKVKFNGNLLDLFSPSGDLDGAYAGRGRAGCGMLLRNDQGLVIYAACRQLPQCHDATEAELIAIEEGLKLGLQWSPLHFDVETDCSEALALITDKAPNIFAYAFRISAIRELHRERESMITKISRDANVPSHELARLARVTEHPDS
jgi:hypothetical protein